MCEQCSDSAESNVFTGPVTDLERLRLSAIQWDLMAQYVSSGDLDEEFEIHGFISLNSLKLKAIREICSEVKIYSGIFSYQGCALCSREKAVAGCGECIMFGHWPTRGEDSMVVITCESDASAYKEIAWEDVTPYNCRQVQVVADALFRRYHNLKEGGAE